MLAAHREGVGRAVSAGSGAVPRGPLPGGRRGRGGITAILNDVKAFAPASVYTMIIGCHGMGWLPVYEMKVRSAPHMKMHWEYQGVPLTRYFGGLTAEYQTDIKSLASGIANAGMKMEYILFDDCYMSSIEVAYELKDVTKYLIGSTSEMMAYGMPYAAIGEYLLGNPDYQSGSLWQ